MKAVAAPHQLLHYIVVKDGIVTDDYLVDTNVTNRPADFARAKLAGAIADGGSLYLKVGG